MSKLVRRASLGLAIVLAMTSLSACDSDNPGQGLLFVVFDLLG